MTLPNQVNPLFTATSGAYTVGRSLRFRSSASAYLNRTPASASNRKTWTWSGWVKRGALGASQVVFEAGNPTGTLIGDLFLLMFTSGDVIRFDIPTIGSATTNAVFRDPSAWYHISIAMDTTQATAANRTKIYVNGVQQTFSAQPAITQNADLAVNNTVAHYHGRYDGSSLWFDGYLAEVNFIDGQALTPSSFGAYDTNGVWQPIKYTGTYGTNGFYLPFSNTTSTTTLVQDSSGNGNNWTPNNISLTAGTTYDSMIDSPTVSASSSNYAVLNPLDKGAGITLSNANLTAYSNATNYITRSTIAVSSGKWYWEAVQTAQGSAATNNMINGIIPPTESTTNNLGYTAGSYGYVDTGNKVNNSVVTAYGATYGLNDIIGVALDLDGGTLTFYKNGVSQGTAFTGISGSFMFAIGDRGGGASKEPTWAINFGQRPFSYTPPTGYNALNTYNLPTPTIANGALYNAATLWTGNGTSQSIANSQNNGGNNPLGKSFYPDFVWYKGRTTTYNHALFDTIRGTLQRLSSNLTSAETATAGSLTAFNSNGFSIGNDAGANQNTDTYVGWQWNAGSGSSSSNTSGSITSTVSVNTTAGFSIVTFTTPSSFTNATVGHGLGVAPAMIIEFLRNASGDTHWVWHQSLSSTQYLQLQTTAAVATNSAIFNGTSSTTFTLGSNTAWGSGNYVAYCFAAIKGYSAFGSYTGNGSADGPFVYTGFRPRWVMVKEYTTAGDYWMIIDTSRDTYNISSAQLYPNASSAESVTGTMDILSNGFKLRYTGGYGNNSGQSYIYAAFAENPFNISRAR